MSKFFLALRFFAYAASAQIQFNGKQTEFYRVDLGTIADAYEIKGDVILKNTYLKKIFLMRADADQGVKVFTSKKTLLPGDTCLFAYFLHS